MMVANSIVARTAVNDFDAFRTAAAMQSVESVDVISIVCRQVEKLTFQATGEMWHIYARFDDNITETSQIDEEISRELDS